jgi:hypothetical protein
MPKFGRFIGLTIPTAISVALLVVVSMAAGWGVTIVAAIICVPALMLGLHIGRKRVERERVERKRHAARR